MENKGLFDLSLDAIAKLHLQETARWARFLAIVGLVLLSIGIVFCLILLVMPGPPGPDADLVEQERVIGLITMLAMGVLYFFPCYFTLLFANRMKEALDTNEAHVMNEAFRNLKRVFRYVGVLTLIFVVLFLLGAVSSLF